MDTLTLCHETIHLRGSEDPQREGASVCPANNNELNNKNNSYHLLNVQSHVARKWKCKWEFICDWMHFTMRLEMLGGGGGGGAVPGFEFVEQREGGDVVGRPRYAAGSEIINKCVTAA